MCLTKHPPQMGCGYFNRSPPSYAQIRNHSKASLPWELQYPWNPTVALPAELQIYFVLLNSFILCF